jgi:DNA processing protein
MNDFVICSGLALGIDSVAHRKTIEYNGLTIAVLAGGIDNIYPPQNRDLAIKIKEKGLIISESMPCIPFEKYHFPQRNRIIAGLSKAICIIEGNVQSGAMITAKFALEQNKDIYALPGDILKPEALGPNTLIQRGAKIILTPFDIVTDFKVEYEPKVVVKKLDLSEDEQRIYDVIKANAPDIHIDNLVIETGMSIGELSGMLFMLELKNAIRTTDSNKYAVL